MKGVDSIIVADPERTIVMGTGVWAGGSGVY